MKSLNSMTITKPNIKGDKTKIKESKRFSIKNGVIIGIITSLIFGYILFDFFVIRHRIENKVVIVNQKFDSLQVHLNNKIPMIDQAIKIQEEQLKQLQDITSAYIKK